MLNNIASLYAGGAAAITTNYVSIQTVTVDSAGASTLTFSSIPSTYTHLQVRMTTLQSAVDNVALQINSDTGNNYWWHEVYGQGTSASAASSGAAVAYIKTGFTNSTSANYTGVSVVDILDYKSTNKYKTVRALTGSDSNGSGYILFRSGMWNSTSAITSLTFYPVSGSFNQYTQFALYGVK